MSDYSERNVAFLTEMGLAPLWQRRASASAPPESISHVDAAASDAASTAWSTAPDMPVMNKVPAAATRAIPQMNWSELKSAVSGCMLCSLCNDRTQTVFGGGDERAKWLFIGEGPGHDEDQQGTPFVGPAGKLLDNMLLAIGLRRGENAYLANTVKCRPIGADGSDRPPTAEERAACLPYLQRQIALLQPTMIVALGHTAALSLLQLDPAMPVSDLRGTVHHYAEVPVIVTYHLAHLLRNPADKRKAWADLCLAVTTYAAG